MSPPATSPDSLASREPLVYLRDLTKRYARLTALAGVSFSMLFYLPDSIVPWPAQRVGWILRRGSTP